MTIKSFLGGQNGGWEDINDFRTRTSNGNWVTADEVRVFTNGKWETVWPTTLIIQVSIHYNFFHVEKFLKDKVKNEKNIIIEFKDGFASRSHHTEGIGLFSGDLSEYDSVELKYDSGAYSTSKGGDGGGGHKNSYMTKGSRGRNGGVGIYNLAFNLRISGSGWAAGGGGGGGGGGSGNTRGKPGGGGAGTSVGRGNGSGSGGHSGDGSLTEGGNGVGDRNRPGGKGGDRCVDGEPGNRPGYGPGGIAGPCIAGITPLAFGIRQYGNDITYSPESIAFILKVGSYDVSGDDDYYYGRKVVGYPTVTGVLGQQDVVYIHEDLPFKDVLLDGHYAVSGSRYTDDHFNNITIDGLLKEKLKVGDRISSEALVTMPRAWDGEYLIDFVNEVCFNILSGVITNANNSNGNFTGTGVLEKNLPNYNWGEFGSSRFETYLVFVKLGQSSSRTNRNFTERLRLETLP